MRLAAAFAGAVGLLAAGLSAGLSGGAAAADQAPAITGAALEQPTGRYGHNVLGGNEYARLRVTAALDGGAQDFTLDLPDDRVFEDITARIADLTGAGRPQSVVVVESSRSGGAQLAVYGLAGGHLIRLAATPPIGRRNRWLAPAGIADFDGDGQNDVAYVEKPHIGGMLRVWTMRDGALVEIARAPGYSNHHIGQDFITGGVRDCGNGPELVLPNFNWSQLMVVRLAADGALVARAVGDGATRAAVDAALNCEI